MRDTRIRRRLAAAGAAVTLAGTMVAAPAHADVGPGNSNCSKGTRLSTTNDWHAFWSHKVRVTDAICWRMASSHAKNFPYESWVQTPHVTLVSYPIPSAETVSLTTKPYLYSVKRHYHKYTWRVSWHFSVKHCDGPCQTFDFSFVVRPNKGTHICMIGGACDSWKRW